MSEEERVMVVPYDPDWPVLFESERSVLLGCFQGLTVRIEHIGSTAVAGLGAKPVIDILLGVDDLHEVERRIPAIEALGYEYVSSFEDELPERRFFRKFIGECRTHNLHCVELNSAFWSNHLAFRDLLRTDHELAGAYYTLKENLSRRFEYNLSHYTDGKTNFIQSTIGEVQL